MNQAVPIIEFDVLVRRHDGEQRLEHVRATSRQAAVKAAEHAGGGKALICVETLRVIGSCSLCSCILFHVDRPYQYRSAANGSPALWRCRDC